MIVHIRKGPGQNETACRKEAYSLCVIELKSYSGQTHNGEDELCEECRDAVTCQDCGIMPAPKKDPRGRDDDGFTDGPLCRPCHLEALRSMEAELARRLKKVRGKISIASRQLTETEKL